MRVRHLVAASALSAAALAVSLPALAECAPGDWFCDESKSKGERGGSEASEGGTATGTTSATGDESREDAKKPAEPEGDGEDHALLVHEPKSKRSTPPRKPKPKRRFGVNGHANLALLGNDPYTDESASMHGAGAAFRFRPLKLIGVDTGLELIGGRDWHGNRRFESALLVHALLFVNPGDRIELHVLSGFGLSQAFVREQTPYGTLNRRFAYVGWDLGFGLDWYATKRLAVGVELLGFLRLRSNNRNDDPEFVDPGTHRATNSSAGGLIRPGVTLYW